MAHEAIFEDKRLVTCNKCGQKVTATRVPDKTWFTYDEPGWTYVAEGRAFCPSCSRKYLKGGDSYA